MRTKARRMGAPEYFKLAHVVGTDGKPAKPIPMPEELRTEFVDAAWRSEEWQRDDLARAAGRRGPPTDLFAYQELLSAAKPDWIIETGTGGGGRALLPGLDLRPDRQRARSSRSTTPRSRSLPSTHGSPTCGRTRSTPRPRRRPARSSATNPRGLLILGASKLDNLMQRVRELLASCQGRRLPGARGHDPERPPRLDRLRPRARRRRRKRITDSGDFVRDTRRALRVQLQPRRLPEAGQMSHRRATRPPRERCWPTCPRLHDWGRGPEVGGLDTPIGERIIAELGRFEAPRGGGDRSGSLDAAVLLPRRPAA